MKNEGLFYKSVRKMMNVKFFLGYRSKTSKKEKEVDVKLAVDVVNFAHWVALAAEAGATSATHSRLSSYWLPSQDSNLDNEIQSLGSYR